MEGREQAKSAMASELQGLRRSQKPSQRLGRHKSIAFFMRGTARRMLAEGGSSEEVAAEARRLGFKQITPSSVKRWAQSSAFEERAMWQEVRKARKLKGSIDAGKKAPPDKEFSVSDARLAKAAQFTGLASPRGAPSGSALQDMIDIQSSLCGALQRENAVLRQRALKLEVRREAISRRIERARIRLDRARWETVQRQLGRLSDALRAPHPPGKPERLADTVRNLCRVSGVSD